MTRRQAEVAELKDGRLGRLMQMHNVTFTELAKSTGISASYLKRVARGEVSNISLDFTQKISKGLGITIAELLGEHSPQDGIAEQIRTVDAKLLAQVSRKLTENLDFTENLPGQFHRSAAITMMEDLLVREVQGLENQLGKLATEPREPVELTVYPLVEKYLVRLIDALPSRSIALAIVRLDDPSAWARDTAKGEWDDFNKAIRIRTHEDTLHYLRLFYFPRELLSQEVRLELDNQRKAGVEVRVRYFEKGETPPPDMLLIWTPTEDRGGPGKTFRPDIQELIEGNGRGYRREWAMKFDVRGGGTYERMRLYAPNSKDARDMSATFLESWSDDKRDPEDGEQQSTREMSEYAGASGQDG